MSERDFALEITDLLEQHFIVFNDSDNGEPATHLNIIERIRPLVKEAQNAAEKAERVRLLAVWAASGKCPKLKKEGDHD